MKCPFCKTLLLYEEISILRENEIEKSRKCDTCTYTVKYGKSFIYDWWFTEIIDVDSYTIRIYHHHNHTWIYNNLTGKNVYINTIINNNKLSLDKIKSYILFS